MLAAVAFVRTLLFFIIFVPFTLVWSSLSGLMALLLPRKWRFYLIVWCWSWFGMQLIRWVVGVRYQVEGREHLPSQPCIIAANHQSAWETLFFQLLLPPQTQVVKRSLINIPFFGWAFRLAGPIAINREDGRAALQQIISEGQERLDSGFHVLIFPEGTRTPWQQPGRYKQGAVSLAAATGAPMVHVIHNSGKYWRNTGFIKYPGTIGVKILPACQVTPGKLSTPLKQLQQQLNEQLPYLNDRY